LQPFKTSSELLRKGRNAYFQSDENALAYLHGLPVVPVHRNKGIDAILKTSPGERPVLIRVQREGESVMDAAEQLQSAGMTKQPATLILVVTNSQPSADLFNFAPTGVLLVDSTATNLVRQLTTKLRATSTTWKMLPAKLVSEVPLLPT
jgi:site-specific DNA-methyltransferase (adenine-specific)